jgi:hypothetical protein
MATYIQNLLNSALGDGARATKFDCDIFFTNSSLFPSSDAMRTLVKTATFPGKSHDIVDFKFKGRSIPLKGQVKYNQTWTCTFYLTEDHKLKNAFGVWLEALDQQHNYTPDVSLTPGLSETQKAHSNSYTTNIMLLQRNFDNSQITAEYNLFNAFPTEISNIEYSAESVGQIQEFTVTFAYSFYDMKVVKGTEGNFIDQYINKAIGDIQSAVIGGFEFVGQQADDAIGAMASKIESALNTDSNNPSGNSRQTNTQVNEQLVKGSATMVRTIEDVERNR